MTKRYELNEDAKTIIEESIGNTDASNASEVIAGMHDLMNIWAGQLSDLNKENKRMRNEIKNVPHGTNDVQQVESIKNFLEKEIEKTTKLAKKRCDSKDVWTLETLDAVLKFVRGIK